MKDKILKLGISKVECEELLSVSKNIDKDYKKLLKGYPIQYLIGYSSFYGYKFKINKNVLIPRFETEFLVEKVKNLKNKYFKEVPVKICDLGTGSGCIAITLEKEINNSIVFGYDISLRALKIAKYNAKINNSNAKFKYHNIQKALTDKFDILVSNPPYVSSPKIVDENVHRYEPHLALYAKDNGLEFYKKIIKLSLKYLNNKSILAFEIGYEQGKSIEKIAREYYPNSKIIIEKDLSNRDRYLFILNNL